MSVSTAIGEVKQVVLRSNRLDERRSRYTVYVSWIAMPVVFLFPLIDNYPDTTATVLRTVIGFIIIANIAVYATPWQTLKSLIPAAGVLMAIAALLYFVYLGHADGASLMWMFIFPMLAMFMLGIIWGMVSTIAILLASQWIMSAGESIGGYNYSDALTLRFVVIFIMVSAMVVCFEYWRVLLEIQKEKIDQELQSTREALAEFASVCAWCNSVKAPDGSWQTLEQYISGKEHLEVSHSICPTCAAKQVEQ